MSVSVGQSASLELEISEEDTAIALRSGTLPVLATPRVVALVEEVSVAAVGEALDEGTTTVGMKVQLDHLAPTAVGRTVVAESTVAEVKGRRICFEVSVTDDRGLVAVGRVTRVVVDVDHFLDKAR